MLYLIVTILLQSTVFAASQPITKSELLAVTGLQDDVLWKKNEKALEQTLFYDNNGISCGLEDFDIEGYNITAGTLTNPTSFEVVNEVTGPTNSCGGVSTYTCYTYFYKKNDQWNTLGAECESTDSYED